MAGKTQAPPQEKADTKAPEAVEQPDMLAEMREKMQVRLGELQPMITGKEAELQHLKIEAQKIEQLLKTMAGESPIPMKPVTHNGGEQTATTTERPPTARRPQQHRRSRRHGRVSGEERRRQIIDLISRNPEITASSIADELGTSSNNVYNMLRKFGIERQNGVYVLPASIGA